MPLQDGDIEVYSIQNKQVRNPLGRFIEVKEIRFRVRGMSDETLLIPLGSYTKDFADQAILRAAADIVDLLEKYPARS